MKIIKKGNLKTNLGRKAYRQLHEKGSVTIAEKCDCGIKIRHNNGGNYHARLSFKRDSAGNYFCKVHFTCELLSDKWREIDPDRVGAKMAGFIVSIGEPNCFIK